MNAIKNKVSINVRNGRILKAGERKLPARLLRFLFGDFTTVYLLSPGQSVDSVEIHEMKEEPDETV